MGSNKVLKSFGSPSKATSPTPPKEGLENTKPGYITANRLSYNLIKENK